MPALRLALPLQIADERTSLLTKAAIKRVQNDACISYAEREQARPKVKDEKTRKIKLNKRSFLASQATIGRAEALPRETQSDL